MAGDAPQLTLLEKVDIVPALLQTLVSAIYGAVSRPFRGDAGAPTYYQHVIYSALRTALSRASIAQSQYLNPSTTEAYEAFAKQKGFAPENITLPDGMKAHWLGNKNAEKVIIQCHGGGYCLPASLPNFQVFQDILDQLNGSGGDVAVLFLAYTLAPKASYPRQLVQGVELLRYVTHGLGKKPSNLIISGDSAGANLTLGVLSHLSHPHPSIAPLELSEPLRAALLIAPWVSFDNTADSFRRNQYKDCIDSRSLKPWSTAFLAGAPADNYNQPLRAPAEWWKDLKVEEVLIIACADEVLVDPIKEVAEKIESVHPKTTTIIVAKECHDSAFINPLIGYKEPSDQAKAIKSWISSRL